MIHDMRHGRWQDVGRDVICDHLITDSPYSDRTHRGRRTGSEVRKSSIRYSALTLRDVYECVRAWDGRVRGWWIFFGDDETVRWWRRALRRQGKYVFPIIPWVKPDAAPRMSGDGPSSATEWLATALEPDKMPVEYLAIARERKMPAVMGSRPGYYDFPTSSTRGRDGELGYPGSKPVPLMRKLLLDYTQPNDTIADPYAGLGTTSVACEMEGRNSVTCEVDAAVYARGRRRVLAGYTGILPGIQAPSPEQVVLFGKNRAEGT